MKDTHIIINPFKFETLLSCKIIKCVNEHLEAEVAGYITEETDELVLRNGEFGNVRISVEDEDGQEEVVFNGIIECISIEAENALKKLVIQARSFTSLLDQKEMIRTFQNKNQTFKAIAQYINEQNNDSVFIYTQGSVKTNAMVVQYNETDWEFLKRIAARLNTVIVSDCKNSNPCLCLGIPRKSGKGEISTCTYRISKRLEQHQILKKNGVSGLSEQDAMEVIVQSRNVLELCDPVTFEGRTLLIYKIETELRGNEFEHTYSLRTENGFKTRAYSNEKIIGTSITGNVIDVKNDIVKVSIDSDNDRPDGVARWFSYATGYSSPEGSGWYCMPERGDKIRVYFPDEEEDNAYVISAVHLGAVDSMRQDPDEKSIRTIYDKEVRFTPTKILITNHKGISITLDDESGISILSNHGIELSASERIEITSGEAVRIQAPNGIGIRQNKNALSISEGGIRMYGLNVTYR